LSQTVTLGIVSAKGRNSNVLGGADYVGDLIQTDAAINPGNSGGPLVTLDGQVMGVNTAIYTRSGGYMGIGFAIPSNLAKDVVAKLKKDGKIVRGWLGVYIQPLDPEMGKELGIKEGVSVHEVVPDSPAQKGGLKAGDVIVEVDGTAVKEVTQLQRSISGFKPGQNVKMKVVSYNDKKSRNLSVKIGDVPPEEEEAPAKVGQAEEAPDKLGLVVAEAKGKEGVVIQYIQPGSLAEQMGIEPGDVISSVNRTKVKNPSAYKKVVSGAKRLNLEIQRKGRTLFYSFSLPE
jgi:serine protease Do